MNEYFDKDLFELEQMTKWLFDHKIPCIVGTEPSWEFGKTLFLVKFGPINDELFTEFDLLYGERPETIHYEIVA